jgi:hypothetical protein
LRWRGSSCGDWSLRQAGGKAGAAARRDLRVGLAVAASWLATWDLYTAYT